VNIIYVDPARCTGCKVCEMVCSLFREDEINPTKSRIYVASWEQAGVDIPIVCQQCEDPPCKEVCPTHAISRNRETGAMVINESACIGCRICISACPFGAPIVRADTGEVVKCDLCKGEPKCVEFCEPKALQYMPASKAAILKKRTAAEKYEELIQKVLVPAD